MKKKPQMILQTNVWEASKGWIACCVLSLAVCSCDFIDLLPPLTIHGRIADASRAGISSGELTIYLPDVVPVSGPISAVLANSICSKITKDAKGEFSVTFKKRMYRHPQGRYFFSRRHYLPFSFFLEHDGNLYEVLLKGRRAHVRLFPDASQEYGHKSSIPADDISVTATRTKEEDVVEVSITEN
jgi:hypothetical protein